MPMPAREIHMSRIQIELTLDHFSSFLRRSIVWSREILGIHQVLQTR